MEDLSRASSRWKQEIVEQKVKRPNVVSQPRGGKEESQQQIKNKSRAHRIPIESLFPEYRCVYASLEEMVVLLKLLLQQVGQSGFLTRTSVDWKQIGNVLSKDPIDCEYLFWNFKPKHFRSEHRKYSLFDLTKFQESLNLVVMEFDPRNIIPSNPEHDKEVDRFRALIVSRMKQLLTYLDEPEKKAVPTAPVLPGADAWAATRPNNLRQQRTLDQGISRHYMSRPMGFGTNPYLGGNPYQQFFPLPGQFGSQYLPFAPQMPHVSQLGQFGNQQFVQIANNSTHLPTQYMYLPQPNMMPSMMANMMPNMMPNMMQYQNLLQYRERQRTELANMANRNNNVTNKAGAISATQSFNTSTGIDQSQGNNALQQNYTVTTPPQPINIEVPRFNAPTLPQ